MNSSDLTHPKMIHNFFLQAGSFLCLTISGGFLLNIPSRNCYLPPFPTNDLFHLVLVLEISFVNLGDVNLVDIMEKFLQVVFWIRGSRNYIGFMWVMTLAR